MEPTRVGIAVVKDQSDWLIGVRGDDGSLPGYAEFPGGKCHNNESHRDCAVRECREETGLIVEADRLLLAKQHSYDHAVVDLEFWLCIPVQRRDANEVKGTFRWVNSSALAQLKFPEANAELLTLLENT